MFDSVIGMREYEKIRKGGVGKLSVSQFVMLSVNMMDANKNLTPAEFERVYALYNEYRKDKVKREYDAESVSKETLEMFLHFDFEADIRQYSGDNPFAHMWRTNDNLGKLRERAHAANERMISAKGLLEEAQKFSERFKNISIEDIIAGVKAGKISQQQAEEIIRLKDAAGPIIANETQKMEQGKREYEECRIAFMKENSLLNGMPEMMKTVYRERGLEYYDKAFLEMFPNFKNPYTNEVIKGVQDYLDAVDSRDSKRAIKTERKLTLEEIDDIFERKYGDRGIRFIGRRIVCAEDYLEAIAAMRAAKRMKSNITNLGSKE